MKSKIVVGNAYKDRNNAHWLVGRFMDTKDLKVDKRIEIGWTSIKAGHDKKIWTKSTKATTMTILIKGKFVNSFPKLGDVVLQKEGDYIIYAPNVPHTRRAIKDSVLLNLRWPSPNKSHVKIVNQPRGYKEKNLK